jgi:membrane fusion protein, multidrug efflux system
MKPHFNHSLFSTELFNNLYTMKKQSSTFKNLIRTTLFITLLAITGAMTSCKEEKQSDPQAIRSQITTYNQQIVELNQKISDLEKQLEQMGETTQNRERTPVGVTEIKPEPFDHFVKVNAQVEAVREASISPEINGQIQQINVSKGQRVTAGQVLARLNTSVIDNNIAEIKTSLQLAETVYNRQKRLWEQEIGSEMQYLEAKNNFESLKSRLKTTESQLAMAFIKAPINGVIDDIFAKEGELAMPGARLMQIISLEELYINADVSETFLPAINTNDKVILRFSVFPDYEELVPIHRMGNVINPENRTFRVQLKIRNQNEQFKPNMMASMSLRAYQAKEALVIPSIMIKQDTQGYFVYVARENEDGELIARKTYIERGLSGEGKTMVSSGLNPGDLFITQGHNRVTDGSLVRIADTRAMAE